jgi:DNA-directed RNA polymerase specialized sigma24 family protein
VLLLAKGEGMPLAHIAEKLNMSLAAVKVTVHRSIKTIRKHSQR